MTEDHRLVREGRIRFESGALRAYTKHSVAHGECPRFTLNGPLPRAVRVSSGPVGN